MSEIERQKNIEKIKEKMCDDYCKYTSKELRIGQEEILKKCENCPLNKLE